MEKSTKSEYLIGVCLHFSLSMGKLFVSKKKAFRTYAAWWNFPGYEWLKISIWNVNVNERGIRWRSKTFFRDFSNIFSVIFLFSNIFNIHHSFINLSNVVFSDFFHRFIFHTGIVFLWTVVSFLRIFIISYNLQRFDRMWTHFRHFMMMFGSSIYVFFFVIIVLWMHLSYFKIKMNQKKWVSAWLNSISSRN